MKLGEFIKTLKLTKQSDEHVSVFVRNSNGFEMAEIFRSRRSLRDIHHLLNEEVDYWNTSTVYAPDFDDDGYDTGEIIEWTAVNVYLKG